MCCLWLSSFISFLTCDYTSVNMTAKLSRKYHCKIIISANGKVYSGGRECSFCFNKKYLLLVVLFRFYGCKAYLMYLTLIKGRILVLCLLQNGDKVLSNNSESWEMWDAAKKPQSERTHQVIVTIDPWGWASLTVTARTYLATQDF